MISSAIADYGKSIVLDNERNIHVNLISFNRLKLENKKEILHLHQWMPYSTRIPFHNHFRRKTIYRQVSVALVLMHESQHSTLILSPFTSQIREKTIYDSPWRQSPRSRVSPDTEVQRIMTPSGSVQVKGCKSEMDGFVIIISF